MHIFKKSLLPLILGIGLCTSSCGQDRGEFANQDNGLMYADSSMKMLSHMVDSLNLRFKSCDISRNYYSDPQGQLWSLEFESSTDDLKDLRRDLDNGISIESLLSKYKLMSPLVDTNLLIVETVSHYDGEEKVYYLMGNPSDGYSEEFILNDIHKKLTPRKWLYKFSKKDAYDKYNHVFAYQIPLALQHYPIPDDYARYIQYVDCMIDTNSVIFLTKHSRHDYRFRHNEEVDDLNKWLNQKMGLKYKKNDYDYQYLTKEKVKYAESNLRGNADFVALLQETVDLCIENSNGSPGLEELAMVFISKEKALELKRHRIVIGQCSQDQSPRYHALEIARLAAETNSWDIFLRAHLDIMNDRFERMSDGSYAYGGRKTYLKELEVLNLDIVDLILGLSLRASNLPNQHYLGTIWRLGWAMTESKDQDIFENKLIKMLKDNRLDEFNRGLLFMLYESYIDKLDDINLANEKIRQIRSQADDYPIFLKAAILKLKSRDKEKA